MISDEQLEEWQSEAREEKSIPQMDYLDERIVKLIQAVRAERAARLKLSKAFEKIIQEKASNPLEPEASRLCYIKTVAREALAESDESSKF